jgi:hypothetical protein
MGNPIMRAKMSSRPDASESDTRLLLENLQDPQFLESLHVLVEKSQALIDVLDKGERTLNSISNRIAELGRAGASALSNGLESFDVDDLKTAGETLKGIIPVVRDFVIELGLMRQAGFFDPEVVKVIGSVGSAMSAAARDPDAHSDEARSIFEFTLLLKDPEVARTLNFIISLARHFGSYLDKNEAGSVR